MTPGRQAARPDVRDGEPSERSSGPDPGPNCPTSGHTTWQGVDPAAGNRVRIAVKILLFLGILVFLNNAVGWLASLVAFQMWPEYVDIAAILLFASIVTSFYYWRSPSSPASRWVSC